uniref:Uncharacterized protein n=1 Tax=Ciona savignyi TaxID=51511 RepID=H2YFP9_CIOSA
MFTLKFSHFRYRKNVVRFLHEMLSTIKVLAVRMHPIAAFLASCEKYLLLVSIVCPVETTVFIIGCISPFSPLCLLVFVWLYNVVFGS